MKRVKLFTSFKGQMMRTCYNLSLCGFVDRNAGVMRVFSPKYPHMRVDPHLCGYKHNTANGDYLRLIRSAGSSSWIQVSGADAAN